MKNIRNKITGWFARPDQESSPEPPPPGAAPETQEVSPGEVERLRRQAGQLQEILKVKPEDAPLHLKLAQTWMAMHRYAEAVAPLQEIIRLDPQHPSATYNLAQCYIERGRDDDAIDLLQAARRNHPESQAVTLLLAQAHTNLCVTLGKLKRWEESMVHFGKATALLPRFGPAHLALGRTYIQQGRYDEAIKKFRETIEMDPHLQVEALHNLAQAHSKKGANRKALKYFQEAIQADPRAALIHQDFGAFHYKQGKLEAAVESFHNALKMSPKLTADTWFKLGLALARLNRTQEAEEPLRQAYELTPDNRQVQDALTAILVRISQIHRQAKKPLEGLALLKEAVSIDPTHAKAQFALAGLYDMTQEGKRAIRHMLFAKNFFLEQK
ncbi:MAG: tetratricopeptide repeat protein, partial [Nitrospinaceae bacterium]